LIWQLNKWRFPTHFRKKRGKGWGTDAKALARARAPGGKGIARKNRSARGTAIGDYHSHEHYSANRNRLRTRFHNAHDVAHGFLDSHAAARKTRAQRISRFAPSWFEI
jgi:hypothetical protein